MKRIAIFIQDEQPRGAQIVAHTIAERLKHKYEFIFFGDKINCPHKIRNDIQSVDAFIPSEFDAYHLHYSYNVYGLDKLDDARKKLIVTTHQRNRFYKGPRRYHTCVSKSAYDETIYDRFINNPIPAIEPDIEGAREICSKRYFLTVGTFHYAKGPDVFISIVKQYLEMGMLSIPFVYAGGGYEREGRAVISAFESLKRQGMNIINAGLVSPQVCSGLIQNCVLLIHPSREEASSLTLIEAQYRKKPIVAIDIEGNRDILRYGFMFNTINIKTYLPTVQFNYERLQENAELISQIHGQSVIDEYDTLYEDVVNG